MIKKIIISCLLSLSVFLFTGCYAIYFSYTVNEVKFVNASEKSVFINPYGSMNEDAILLPGDAYQVTYKTANYSKIPYITFWYCLDYDFHNENKDEDDSCEKCGHFSEEESVSPYVKKKYEVVINKDGKITCKSKN